MNITENFKEKEFACKCCGKIKYDIKLVAKLECIRAAIGNVPIIVTSGYRCEKHNAKVGGAKKSYHLKGQAVDITIRDMSKFPELLRIAKNVNANGGVGIYPNFIHLDSGYKRTF